jgi:hypothetical protein
MTIDWAYWLMEIGSWLISIGLTFGSFVGMLWVMAWLIGKGER